jgi:hypothetical protein
MPAGSDHEREFVEGDAEPVTVRGLGGDVVVAAAQVLHEGVSRGENPARAVTLQPAHRPQPCFQPPVVCPGRIVRMSFDGMQGRRHEFVEHPRVNPGHGLS